MPLYDVLPLAEKKAERSPVCFTFRRQTRHKSGLRFRISKSSLTEVQIDSLSTSFDASGAHTSRISREKETSRLLSCRAAGSPSRENNLKHCFEATSKHSTFELIKRERAWVHHENKTGSSQWLRSRAPPCNALFTPCNESCRTIFKFSRRV